jgi:hypothetical protein
MKQTLSRDVTTLDSRLFPLLLLLPSGERNAKHFTPFLKALLLNKEQRISRNCVLAWFLFPEIEERKKNLLINNVVGFLPETLCLK